MKMKKNFFKSFSSIILCFVLGVIIFTGCSNSSSNKEETKDKKQETTQKESYKDSSYIVGSDWLSKNLNKDNVIIVDARPDKDYKKGHIPGAINVQWPYFTNQEGKPGEKDWGMLLPEKELSKKLSSLGIDKNKTIVAYAENKSGWGEDGRIIWMLRMIGIENSKMLNGGFDYWKNKSLEISKDDVTPKKSDFIVENMDKSMYADTKWVKENLDKIKILDAREEVEYKGATKYGEARGGHLPGAKLFTFNKAFNEDQSLKSQKEIEGLLTEAGIKKDDEILTYCTAGIRSAHLALVLKMCGYNNVKNYDGSFYMWSADKNLQIEK
ncbi:TPA: sulfurtransferase [Clostridium botulinum]|uniref:sulfurtransferase n=1 Tax=Clostridium botulinum TaxID=1491 RepID=UPI00099B4219|nr:sulfurtransferase [Clostridium botulinum]NFA96015.1 sulfurtransferase [Clostridium botulinum]NFB53281.1 sulfurtransferase [Clostridium botulinum]NFC77600.1 sulfurtransferase [Clostridium botulinum]NFC87413.1 sulfurtransferase [Clostridium botulinum]NFD05266.1 sulfurtransferase [Clostridium botulinum]